jgi:hypothetical protein
MMAQAVWQPTTVAGTEVFGGFVGDNFLNEQQSLYSAELLEAAILVGDHELAKRAVAALRAPLALVKHQTHGVSGMELPIELEIMQSASWFGRGGQAAFGTTEGIAEGTAQTLTSIAYVTQKFGSVYTSPQGWKLAIDGLEVDENGTVYSSFSRNPLAFQSVYPYIEVDGKTGERRELSDPPVVPAFRSIKLALDGASPYVVALPGFALTNVNELSGSFLLPNGTTVKAGVFPSGLGASIQDAVALGGISFRGEYRGRPLSVPRTFLSVGPPDLDLAWPRGWRRMKGLSDVIKSSLSRNGVTVVSTADDGKGARRPAQTGVIESQAFLMTGIQLTCQIDTGGAKNVRIDVVDLGMGAVVSSKSWTSKTPGTVVFDLPSQKGAMLRVRLVDETTTGSIEAWDFQMVGS